MAITTIEAGQLSDADQDRLLSMRQEREIRDIVAEILKGSVRPVHIDFRLVHPWLRRFGLGNNQDRHVILALKRGVEIPDKKLQGLNQRLVEWGQQQSPVIPIVQSVIRRA